MKKVLLIFSLILLSCLPLVSCTSNINFAEVDNSNRQRFVFFVNLGNGENENIGIIPIADLIILDENEAKNTIYDLISFLNFKNKGDNLETFYPHYLLKSITYSDGHEFTYSYEETNSYLNSRKEDERDTGFFSYDNHYFVYLNYEPIIYSINYEGYENETSFATSYDINNSVTLPVLENGEYRTFVGWKDINTNDILTSTPNIPRDLNLVPVYNYETYNINYSLPFDIANPNPTSYTYYDETIVLQPFENSEDGSYEFLGFYLNNEKIETINTKLLKHLDVECRFELNNYTANYYIDDEFYISKEFNIATLKEFIEPVVPTKEHYHNERWNKSVEELKNYEINALYDIDTFTIQVISNGSEENLIKVYEYGTNFEQLRNDLVGLNINEKLLYGMYSDNSYNIQIEENQLIEANQIVYAKWLTKIHIKNYSDLLTKLSSEIETIFYLDDDINCEGEGLPIISSFNGIFDGQNYKITNFISQNSSINSDSFGIFGANYGTIKNLTFVSGSFYVSRISGNIIQGFLTSVNNGIIENVHIDKSSFRFDNTLNGSGAYAPQSAPDTYYGQVGIFAGQNSGNIIGCSISKSVTAQFYNKMSFRDTNIYVDYYVKPVFRFGHFVGINYGYIDHVTSSASSSVTTMMVSNHGVDGFINCVSYGEIAGYNLGEINYCQALGELNDSHSVSESRWGGEHYIGGIVGLNDNKINFSASSSNITSIAHSAIRVGGLIGENGSNGRVKASYVANSTLKFGISNNDVGSYYVGGFIGYNRGTILTAYVANVNLEANAGNAFDYIGGFVGFNNDIAFISKSFSISTIQGNTSTKTFNFGYSGSESSFSDCYSYATAKNEYTVLDENIYELDYFVSIEFLNELDFSLFEFNYDGNDYPVLYFI